MLPTRSWSLQEWPCLWDGAPCARRAHELPIQASRTADIASSAAPGQHPGEEPCQAAGSCPTAAAQVRRTAEALLSDTASRNAPRPARGAAPAGGCRTAARLGRTAEEHYRRRVGERLSEQGRQGRRRRFPAQPWQATQAAAEPAADSHDCGAGGHAAQPAGAAEGAAMAAGAQHQRAAQPADVIRPAARPEALVDAPAAAAVWDDSDDAELAGWAEASAAAARTPLADAARPGGWRAPPPAAGLAGLRHLEPAATMPAPWVRRVPPDTAEGGAAARPAGSHEALPGIARDRDLQPAAQRAGKKSYVPPAEAAVGAAAAASWAQRTNPAQPERAQLPVDWAQWDDAQRAARWLGKQPIDRNSAMRRLLSEMKVRAARVAAPCPASPRADAAAEELSAGESASAQVAGPCVFFASCCCPDGLPYPTYSEVYRFWQV